MTELTATELSNKYNVSLSHLWQLEKRGIMPKGRKEGKLKLYPAMEAHVVLSNHVPGERWLASPGQVKINWLNV